MLDQDEDSLWQTATQMFHSGNYSACETALRNILAQNPNALRARYNLAQIVSKGENARDSVPMFCDCIRRQFQVEGCVRRVVSLYIKEREFRVALRFYKGYVTPEIESEDLMQLKCLALFRLKEYEDCRKVAGQMLLRNNDNHEAYFTLALVGEALGNIPDAIDSMRIALYLEPKDKYAQTLRRLRAAS